MAQRILISDDHCIDAVMDYCREQGIAMFQGRSYRDGQQFLAWQIYCEDSKKLDFLLLKYSGSLTLL